MCLPKEERRRHRYKFQTLNSMIILIMLNKVFFVSIF